MIETQTTSATLTETRPEHPPWDASEGYEWRVEPDDGPLRWAIATEDEAAKRICRRSVRRPCPNSPAAYMLRGRSVRYFYCADHMYGRWIENGRVVQWVVRKTVPA